MNKKEIIDEVLNNVENSIEVDYTTEVLSILENILDKYLDDNSLDDLEKQIKEVDLYDYNDELIDAFIYYDDAFNYLNHLGYINNYQGALDAIKDAEEICDFSLDDDISYNICNVAMILLENEYINLIPIIEKVIEELYD